MAWNLSFCEEYLETEWYFLILKEITQACRAILVGCFENC